MKFIWLACIFIMKFIDTLTEAIKQIWYMIMAIVIYENTHDVHIYFINRENIISN